MHIVRTAASPKTAAPRRSALTFMAAEIQCQPRYATASAAPRYAAIIRNWVTPQSRYIVVPARRRPGASGAGCSSGSGVARAAGDVATTAPARLLIVGFAYTSLIVADGRSGRFRSRAQNRAITSESAP